MSIVSHVKDLFYSERHFGRWMIALIGLGFAALLAAAAAAVWTQMESDSLSERLAHTNRVERKIGDLRVLVERAETARRGYLINADPIFRRTYDEVVAQIPPLLTRLADRTSDNPAQQERLAELQSLAERMFRYQQRSLAMVDAGAADVAVDEFRNDSSTDVVRQFRRVTVAMAGEETRLLALRTSAQQRVAAAFYIILGVAAVLLLIVAALSISVILRYTRDLAASRNALQMLNENLEDAVKERTTELSRANDEIQRFAYIVSHDLRSPLVNVMGFTAELDAARDQIGKFVEKAEPGVVPEEVAVAVNEDLPEAIGFIRTSTQKMDRLINSILQLSRQGRRTISPEPLDMEKLAQGVADSLYQRAEAAGAEIVVETPLPQIVSDRLAIEQILSNLVENAVKYLSPKRAGRVVVRGSRQGNRAVFEVEDNGRGIDPKDHERVFDLFRRSGAQDQPGEGIGLAHVRALAYRLGGIVDCRSALDEGATFRLSLPLHYREIKGTGH